MSIAEQDGGCIRRLASHYPPKQFARYVVVGIGNTLFSYGSFAVLTAVLTPYIPHAYIVASVISNILSITVSYLNYKWFIFKTPGNYLREWLKALAVYSGSSIVGILLLPILVFLIRSTTTSNASAPYIAGALIAGISVLLSFFGHKNFTFRTSSTAE